MKPPIEVPVFLSKTPAVTIPDDEIRAMRRMQQEGKTPKQIALAFPHVSQCYVYKVLAGTVRKRIKQ